MSMQTRIFTIVFLMAFAALSGCAPTGTVPLTYAPLHVLDAKPGTGSVSVIKFTDETEKGLGGKSRLGRTSEGLDFFADSSLAEWVSWAVYDELKEAGINVEYHPAAGEYGTDFDISGQVQSLKLDQTSSTDYEGSMRVRLVIESKGNHVHSEKFYSEVTKVVFPSKDAPREIVMEVLQGIMTELVPVVADKARLAASPAPALGSGTGRAAEPGEPEAQPEPWGVSPDEPSESDLPE